MPDASDTNPQQTIESALEQHPKLAEEDKDELLGCLQRVYRFCVVRETTFPLGTIVLLAGSPWSAMGALSCGILVVTKILVDEHLYETEGPTLLESMQTAESTFETKDECYNEARSYVMESYKKFTDP